MKREPQLSVKDTLETLDDFSKEKTTKVYEVTFFYM